MITRRGQLESMLATVEEFMTENMLNESEAQLMGVNLLDAEYGGTVSARLAQRFV